MNMKKKEEEDEGGEEEGGREGGREGGSEGGWEERWGGLGWGDVRGREGGSRKLGVLGAPAAPLRSSALTCSGVNTTSPMLSIHKRHCLGFLYSQ
jgi:hypothetical protein